MQKLRRFLMEVAWSFDLPVTIRVNSACTKGFLSTTKDRFGEFWLHELSYENRAHKRVRHNGAIGPLVMQGKCEDITSVRLSLRRYK